MKDESVTHLLEKLLKDTNGEEVAVGEVLESFQHRGFGPLLLIPSLIALLPTGAIPGVPTICGVLLFLICTQLAAGRSHPWIPMRLQKLCISRKKLKSAIEKSLPYVKKVEKLLSPRITVLSQHPAINIIAAFSGIIALCMVPLELIPFAVALPASAIAITAVGITNRDGFFIIAGLLLQSTTTFLLIPII